VRPTSYVGSSLLILYILLLLLPSSGGSYATGLDMSWVYALNALPGTEYEFGRDVAFTFGPLGQVNTGVLAGPGGPRGALLRVFLHLALGVALFLCLAQSRSRRAFWCFAVCFLIACTWSFGEYYDLYYDYHLLFLIGLYASAALGSGRARLTALYLAAFVAGLGLFIKLNTGVAAAGMLGLAALVLLLRRRGDWRHVVASGALYLATVLTFAHLLLGSLGHLPTWLRASYEFVHGYNSAMTLAGPRSALLRALATWTAYLAFAGWCAWRKRPLGLIAVLLLAPVFIGFKGGFVRQDGLAPFFFLTVPMMTTLFILSAEEPRDLGLSLAFFGLTLALAIPTRIDYWRALPSWPRELFRIVSLQRGIGRIGPFLRLSAAHAQADVASRAQLEPDRLPAEWLAGIDKKTQTVAVVPWEITYCPANDLRWDPTPTLQLYASYTAWLDEWNARHFEGLHRPDWIIAHYDAIDGRHPLWEAPATWRALLGNYRIGRADATTPRLLLQKNGPPTTPELATVGESVTTAHQWVPVPDSDAALYMTAEVPRRIAGALRETFFRFPPIVVELFYEDGQPGGGRVPPDVMSNGLLINYLPRNAQELAAFFECRATARVRRIRITGPGAEQLASPIRLAWKRVVAPPCPAVTVAPKPAG
jgi:hypothetical protein